MRSACHLHVGCPTLKRRALKFKTVLPKSKASKSELRGCVTRIAQRLDTEQCLAARRIVDAIRALNRRPQYPEYDRYPHHASELKNERPQRPLLLLKQPIAICLRQVALRDVARHILACIVDLIEHWKELAQNAA